MSSETARLAAVMNEIGHGLTEYVGQRETSSVWLTYYVRGAVFVRKKHLGTKETWLPVRELLDPEARGELDHLMRTEFDVRLTEDEQLANNELGDRLARQRGASPRPARGGLPDWIDPETFHQRMLDWIELRLAEEDGLSDQESQRRYRALLADLADDLVGKTAEQRETMRAEYRRREPGMDYTFYLAVNYADQQQRKPKKWRKRLSSAPVGLLGTGDGGLSGAAHHLSALIEHAGVASVVSGVVVLVAGAVLVKVARSVRQARAPPTAERTTAPRRRLAKAVVVAGVLASVGVALLSGATASAATTPSVTATGQHTVSGGHVGGRAAREPDAPGGVWIARRGDSYWRILVVRFHDLPRYLRTVAGLPHPDRLAVGTPVRVADQDTSGSAPEETQTPGQTQTPSESPSPSALPTSRGPQARQPAQHGDAPWGWLPGLGVLGLGVLGLGAAFLGWRHRHAIGAAATDLRELATDLSALPAGPVGLYLSARLLPHRLLATARFVVNRHLTLLKQAPVPTTAREDIYRLVAQGRVDTARLRQLVEVGRRPGRAAAAQWIGQFVGQHDLGWSPRAKRDLRRALEMVPTWQPGIGASLRAVLHRLHWLVTDRWPGTTAAVGAALTRLRTFAAAHKRGMWVAAVAVGIAVVAGVVLLGGTRLMVLSAAAGAVAQLARGTVGSLRNTARASALSSGVVAALLGLVAMTRLVSVDTNMAAAPTGAGAVVFWSVLLTAVAHAATAVHFEIPASTAIWTRHDGQNQHHWAWWTVGLVGMVSTVVGVGFSVVDLAGSAPGSTPLSVMISLATMVSMASGVTYQTYHLVREDVVGLESDQAHRRIGGLLHDLALAAYAVNTLAAHSVAALLGSFTALGVTMLAWSIVPRAPPGTERDGVNLGFTALVNVAGILGGLLSWRTTHGFASAATSVVVTESVVLGLSWVVHRWFSDAVSESGMYLRVAWLSLRRTAETWGWALHDVVFTASPSASGRWINRMSARVKSALQVGAASSGFGALGVLLLDRGATTAAFGSLLGATALIAAVYSVLSPITIRAPTWFTTLTRTLTVAFWTGTPAVASVKFVISIVVGARLLLLATGRAAGRVRAAVVTAVRVLPGSGTVPTVESWSRSRARWFWVTSAYAVGFAMLGVLIPTVVIPAGVGLAAGALATSALAGNVVGLFTLNNLWSAFSRRWLAVVTFAGMAGALAWTATATTAGGFTAAAFLLGLTASTWPSMIDRVDQATEEYLDAHRGRTGQLTVGLVVEVVVFGSVFVLASVLAAQTWLVGVSFELAAWMGVPLAALAAVGVLVTWPKEHPDRDRPGLVDLVVGPLVAVRHGVGRWLVVSGAGVGLLLSLFDNFWREVPEVSPGWEAVIGYGLVLGGLLPVLIEKLGHRGGRGGFVDSRPGAFSVVMGALVFASGLAVLLGGVLVPTLAGIAVASVVHEAGSNGLLPGWQGLIKKNVPEAQRGLVLAGVTLSKNIFQFIGGWLGTQIWSGAVSVLPAGWEGIRYAMTGAGAIALVVLVVTAARFDRTRGPGRAEAPRLSPMSLLHSRAGRYAVAALTVWSGYQVAISTLPVPVRAGVVTALAVLVWAVIGRGPPGEGLSDVRRTVPDSPRPGVFSVLRERNFRLHLTGQTITLLGTWVQIVAVDWVVFRLSGGHSLALGIAIALQATPVLLAPWAGVWVDRFDAGRLLLVVRTLSGLAALLLAVQFATDTLSLAELYGLAVFEGVAAAVEIPAAQVFGTRLTEQGKINTSSSLPMVANQLTRVVGPVIAGLLIATVGPSWTFLLNALSFGVVIWTQLLMRIERGGTTARLEPVTFVQGLTFLRGSPALLGALGLEFVVSAAASAALTLTALSTQVFGLGVDGYSVMVAVTAVGASGISIALSVLLGRRAAGPTLRWVIAGALTFGIFDILSGSMSSLTATMGWLLLVGAGATTVFMSADIMLLQNERMRGRMLGLSLASFNLGRIVGGVGLGAVAGLLGPRAPAIVGGAVVAATVALGVIARPLWLALRRPASGSARYLHDRSATPGHPVTVELWTTAAGLGLAGYEVLLSVGYQPVAAALTALLAATGVLRWSITRRGRTSTAFLPGASEARPDRLTTAVNFGTALMAVGWAATAAVVQWPLSAWVGLVAFAVRGAVLFLRASPWSSSWALPGWLDRGLHAVVAVSWLVNLSIHLPATLASTGFARAVNLVLTVADVLFGISTSLVALDEGVAVLATRSDAWATLAVSLSRMRNSALIAWTTRNGAAPALSVGVGMLAVQLTVTGPVVSVVPLTVLFAALSVLAARGIAAKRGWTRPMGAEAAKASSTMAGTGLVAYALSRLQMADLPVALATSTVLAVTGLLLYSIFRRGPPGQGSREAFLPERRTSSVAADSRRAALFAVGGLAATSLGVVAGSLSGLMGWLPGAGGMVVGLLTGIFGAGGSLVTNPALNQLLGQSLHAAATGALVIVGAANLIRAVQSWRTLDWRTGLLVSAAGIPTALLTGTVARHLDQHGLQVALAALMGAAAVKMAYDAVRGQRSTEPVGGRAIGRKLVIGTVAGALTGLLGIGGAFVIVPALVMGRVASLRTATVTVAMVTAINSAVGLLPRADELAALDWGIIAPFAATAVLTTLLGRHLQKLLPKTWLQLGFAVFLTGVAGLTAYQAVAALTRSTVLAVTGTGVFVVALVAVTAKVLRRGSGHDGGFESRLDGPGVVIRANPLMWLGGAGVSVFALMRLGQYGPTAGAVTAAVSLGTLTWLMRARPIMIRLRPWLGRATVVLGATVAGLLTVWAAPAFGDSLVAGRLGTSGAGETAWVVPTWLAYVGAGLVMWLAWLGGVWLVRTFSSAPLEVRWAMPQHFEPTGYLLGMQLAPWLAGVGLPAFGVPVTVWSVGAVLALAAVSRVGTSLASSAKVSGEVPHTGLGAFALFMVAPVVLVAAWLGLPLLGGAPVWWQAGLYLGVVGAVAVARLRAARHPAVRLSTPHTYVPVGVRVGSAAVFVATVVAHAAGLAGVVGILRMVGPIHEVLHFLFGWVPTWLRWSLLAHSSVAGARGEAVNYVRAYRPAGWGSPDVPRDRTRWLGRGLLVIGLVAGGAVLVPALVGGAPVRAAELHQVAGPTSTAWLGEVGGHLLGGPGIVVGSVVVAAVGLSVWLNARRPKPRSALTGRRVASLALLVVVVGSAAGGVVGLVGVAADLFALLSSTASPTAFADAAHDVTSLDRGVVAALIAPVLVVPPVVVWVGLRVAERLRSARTARRATRGPPPASAPGGPSTATLRSLLTALVTSSDAYQRLLTSASSDGRRRAAALSGARARLGAALTDARRGLYEAAMDRRRSLMSGGTGVLVPGRAERQLRRRVDRLAGMTGLRDVPEQPARPAGRSTLRGAILTSGTDDLGQVTLDVRVGPNDFTVIAHGGRRTGRSVAVLTDDGVVRLTVRELADLLESLEHFRLWRLRGVGDLVIPGCDMACYPIETQALADRLNVTVVVADSAVFFHAPDVAGGPAKVALAEGGRWVRFVPRSRAAPELSTSPFDAPGAVRLAPEYVRSTLGPEAGWIRAGAGSADDRLTSAQRQAVDLLVRHYGDGGRPRDGKRKARAGLLDERERTAFRADPDGYRPKWFGSLFGPILELLGLPVVEGLTGPNERVLPNVRLYAVVENNGKSTFLGSLAEIDYLVAGPEGTRLAITSKVGGVGRISRSHERESLARLFDRLAGTDAEVEALARSAFPSSVPKRATGFSLWVTWAGASEPMALADFRAGYPGSANSTGIRSLTPSDQEGNLRVPFTRDEIAEVGRAGVARRVRELGPFDEHGDDVTTSFESSGIGGDPAPSARQQATPQPRPARPGATRSEAGKVERPLSSAEVAELTDIGRTMAAHVTSNDPVWAGAAEQGRLFFTQKKHLTGSETWAAARAQLALEPSAIGHLDHLVTYYFGTNLFLQPVLSERVKARQRALAGSDRGGRAAALNDLVVSLAAELVDKTDSERNQVRALYLAEPGATDYTFYLALEYLKQLNRKTNGVWLAPLATLAALPAATAAAAPLLGTLAHPALLAAGAVAGIAMIAMPLVRLAHRTVTRRRARALRDSALELEQRVQHLTAVPARLWLTVVDDWRAADDQLARLRNAVRGEPAVTERLDRIGERLDAMAARRGADLDNLATRITRALRVPGKETWPDSDSADRDALVTHFVVEPGDIDDAVAQSDHLASFLDEGTPKVMLGHSGAVDAGFRLEGTPRPALTVTDGGAGVLVLDGLAGPTFGLPRNPSLTALGSASRAHPLFAEPWLLTGPDSGAPGDGFYPLLAEAWTRAEPVRLRATEFGVVEVIHEAVFDRDVARLPGGARTTVLHVRTVELEEGRRYRFVEVYPVAAMTEVATRKPHGADVDEQALAARATGDVLPDHELGALGDELAGRQVNAPDGFEELFTELSNRVDRVVDVMRSGQLPDGTGVVFHRLAEPIVDDDSGLATDAVSYRVEGVLRVYFTDLAGLVHEVVEQISGSHQLATLAERAVEHSPNHPNSWVTARVVREIAQRARRDPAGWAAFVLDYPRVRDEIAAGFPAGDPVRGLLEHYAAEVNRVALRLLEPVEWDGKAGGEAYLGQKALDQLTIRWQNNRLHRMVFDTLEAAGRRMPTGSERYGIVARALVTEAEARGLSISAEWVHALTSVLVVVGDRTAAYPATDGQPAVDVGERFRSFVTTWSRALLRRVARATNTRTTEPGSPATGWSPRELPYFRPKKDGAPDTSFDALLPEGVTVTELVQRHLAHHERLRHELYSARGELPVPAVTPEPEPLADGWTSVDASVDDPLHGRPVYLHELGERQRDWLAAELTARLAGGSTPEPVAGHLADLVRLLRGQPTRSLAPAAVRFHQLRRPLLHPVTWRVLPEFATSNLGVLSLYFTDLAGLARLAARWFAEQDGADISAAGVLAEQAVLGHELDTGERAELAIALAEPVAAPLGFTVQFATLRRYVAATARQLTNPRERIRFVRWDHPVRIAGEWTTYRTRRDEQGVLVVEFTDSMALVRALTEAWFARDEFGAFAPTVARLAERAAGASAREPWSWLTDREWRSLAELAERDPAGWAESVRGGGRLEAPPGPPEWAALERHVSRELATTAGSRVVPLPVRPRTSAPVGGDRASAEYDLLLGLLARDVVNTAGRLQITDLGFSQVLQAAAGLVGTSADRSVQVPYLGVTVGEFVDHHEDLDRRLRRALGRSLGQVLLRSPGAGTRLRGYPRVGDPADSAIGDGDVHYWWGTADEWIAPLPILMTPRYEQLAEHVRELRRPGVRYRRVERPMNHPDTGELLDAWSVRHEGRLYVYYSDEIGLLRQWLFDHLVHERGWRPEQARYSTSAADRLTGGPSPESWQSTTVLAEQAWSAEHDTAAWVATIVDHTDRRSSLAAEFADRTDEYQLAVHLLDQRYRTAMERLTPVAVSARQARIAHEQAFDELAALVVEANLNPATVRDDVERLRLAAGRFWGERPDGGLLVATLGPVATELRMHAAQLGATIEPDELVGLSARLVTWAAAATVHPATDELPGVDAGDLMRELLDRRFIELFLAPRLLPSDVTVRGLLNHYQQLRRRLHDEITGALGGSAAFDRLVASTRVDPPADGPGLPYKESRLVDWELVEVNALDDARRAEFLELVIGLLPYARRPSATERALLGRTAAKRVWVLPTTRIEEYVPAAARAAFEDVLLLSYRAYGPDKRPHHVFFESQFTGVARLVEQGRVANRLPRLLKANGAGKDSGALVREVRAALGGPLALDEEGLPQVFDADLHGRISDRLAEYSAATPRSDLSRWASRPAQLLRASAVPVYEGDPELLADLLPPGVQVVLYVASDARGRTAMFDFTKAGRLAALNSTQQLKLVRRELARVAGRTERQVRKMPLPSSRELRALVGAAPDATDVPGVAAERPSTSDEESAIRRMLTERGKALRRPTERERAALAAVAGVEVGKHTRVVPMTMVDALANGQFGAPVTGVRSYLWPTTGTRPERQLYFADAVRAIVEEYTERFPDAPSTAPVPEDAAGPVSRAEPEQPSREMTLRVLLSALRRSRGLTLHELADRLHVTTEDIRVVVVRLVEWRSIDHDPVTGLLTLTDHGRRMLGSADPATKQALRRWPDRGSGSWETYYRDRNILMPHGPAGGGLTVRRYSLREHRTLVEAVGPVLSGRPYEPGMVEVLEWASVEPLLPRGRLPDAGDEVVLYTVFDDQSRPRRFRFDVVERRLRDVDEQTRAVLEELFGAHEDRHAANPSASGPEDGWDDHEAERHRLAGLYSDALAGRLTAANLGEIVAGPTGVDDRVADSLYTAPVAAQDRSVLEAVTRHPGRGPPSDLAATVREVVVRLTMAGAVALVLGVIVVSWTRSGAGTPTDVLHTVGAAAAAGVFGRGSRPTEAELIEVVVSGDAEKAAAAFGELFALHRGAASTVARNNTRSAADAEDVISETFLKLFDIMRRGTAPENFRGYLMTTLRHEAARLARTKNEELPLELDTLDALAEHTVRFAEHDDALSAAFRQLSPRWQRILWLTEVLGHRPADIAAEFDLSPNATAALARRARKALRAGYLGRRMAPIPTDLSATHRDQVLQLPALVLGTVARGDQAALNVHLAGCESCRNRQAELTRLASELDR